MSTSFATTQVNLFKGSHRPTPVKTLSLAQALDAIRNGTYKRQVERLRRLLGTPDQAAYDKGKAGLDAITPCGMFKIGRAHV